MKLKAELFQAYLNCPTKCWLLSQAERGAGNVYAEWVKQQNQAYRNESLQRLLETVPNGERVMAPTSDGIKPAKWRIAAELVVQAPWVNASDSVQSDALAVTERPRHPGDGGAEPGPQPEQWFLESAIDALERVPKSRTRAAHLVPIRFIRDNNLTKDDKLLLAYDALTLSQVLGRQITAGKIVHGDELVTMKIKTTPLARQARKTVEEIATMISSGSPPDLVLNRRCSECEFEARCRQEATAKDDLSLLSNMKGKERSKFNSEGIFTVTQLSYTFRPRRRPKRLRDRREKYHHALRALAIRERKIHIVGRPELKIDGTPVYLDVEGLPDRDFYYLVGARVHRAGSAVQYSFWASSLEEEKTVWSGFLELLSTIANPVLIHYGSYETTFLKRMCDRYYRPPDSSAAGYGIKAALNALSFLFAQIYFPTYSNRLKDIGAWLGCHWTSANASGTQSIIWRTQWEKSGDPALKQELINYNSEDCQALETLTDTLTQLCSPDHRSDLENGTDPKAVFAEPSTSKDTLWPRFSSAIESFASINKAARWDFQRERVYIRTDQLLNRASKARKCREKRIKRTNEEVVLAREPVCPNCDRRMDKVGSATKTTYDIRFSRFGLKRWVVTYRFDRLWCRHCNSYLGKPEHIKPWGWCGRNLVMFMMFKIVDLCMTQRAVADELNHLFGLGLQEGEVHRMKSRAAEHYADARARILAKMLKGNLIHADETPIVLKHKRGYVWVFATFHEVAYFYTETREGTFVEQALKEFKGVIVSDFYSPYDALPCPQQKCLIHLMRDLNDAVLDYPYDEELKGMVVEFGELLRSIVQTIDRWGLKSRFLGKHIVDVARFYRKRINITHRSEPALKWKERFLKNREGLFTFLSHDGIPWNNNNAEHAIKAFARLRRAILGLSTAKGIEEYLILLSVCQTCKYSSVDFLDFLLSGDTDVDSFAQKRRKAKQRTAECPF
ncbi:MAG: IS66 family transposase [Verrucomicrobiota bacterium]|jgi:predicted RecB family nuclease